MIGDNITSANTSKTRPQTQHTGNRWFNASKNSFNSYYQNEIDVPTKKNLSCSGESKCESYETQKDKKVIVFNIPE